MYSELGFIRMYVGYYLYCEAIFIVKLHLRICFLWWLQTYCYPVIQGPYHVFFLSEGRSVWVDLNLVRGSRSANCLRIIFLRKPLCHLGDCIGCLSSLRQCGEGSIIIPAGSLICARTQGSVEPGKVILSPPSADTHIISPRTWTLMKMAIAPDENTCH